MRWSATELKLLRRNAGKVSLDSLARVLKRTRAAVQFKGWQEGLSMRYQARGGKRARSTR